VRILVTGATGFIGSHTAAALVAHGHQVRVLARNPSRVPLALGPHGVEPEVAVGDMTDPIAVARAIAGCDGVIHAAAQTDVGASDATGRSNLEGVRTVLGAAIEHGLPRIVYTSSVSVHMPPTDATITLQSPLAEPMSSYSASKIAAEHLVRAWQAEGKPITTVVVGGAYGPLAPDLINGFRAILAAVEARMMLTPAGGTTVIDVRDLALLLARTVDQVSVPPRVLAGGHFLTWERWVDALEAAVGHVIVKQPVTRDEILNLAKQLTNAAAGQSSPLTEEAAMIMASGVPVDGQRSLDELGITLRPVEETFADTVEYLRSIGRLPSPA